MGDKEVTMKIRFFVASLCLALLFSLLPPTVLAINHISLVDVNVATAEHGATPQKPEVTNDRISVYAYEWYENGNKLYYGETFKGGNTYTLKVRLSTLDEFMESTSVKVNGRAAKVLSVDNNNTGLLFEIAFYVAPYGYSLSFDPGYGSGTMVPLTGNTSYILPVCTFTPPSGKEFGYWLVEETNSEYQPGENIFLTKNTTIRAVWKTPSGKTKIYAVEATSNIASIAILYSPLKAPDITVTKGAPARILNSAGNLSWQKKVNGIWETQSSGRFTAGEWRIQTQVRIDADAAVQYELGNPATLKVDGVQWTMANNGAPSIHYDYSMIFAYSPSITIKDDPNVPPPKEITKVALTVTGYKLGAKAQNAKVTCDNEGVIVAAAEFAGLEDSNNDGIPDKATPVERFEAGKQYAVSFTLKAKDGYDISTLGIVGVTCNEQETIGAYNAQENCYNGMGSLPVFDTCTISFAAGGGTGKMSAVTVEKGAYTLPQNEFTAPEGKAFKAWNVGGKEQAPGSKITLTGNTTVTAIWEDLSAAHICILERVAKVAPTCTEDGKEAYFRCRDCGRFFEDDAGKKEITDLSAWGKLEKLGHTDESKDGKCDVCDFMLTETTQPEETEPSTNQTPITSHDKSDLAWLWIALPLILVLGVTTATIIIKKRASTK